MGSAVAMASGSEAEKTSEGRQRPPPMAWKDYERPERGMRTSDRGCSTAAGGCTDAQLVACKAAYGLIRLENEMKQCETTKNSTGSE